MSISVNTADPTVASGAVRLIAESLQAQDVAYDRCDRGRLEAYVAEELTAPGVRLFQVSDASGGLAAVARLSMQPFDSEIYGRQMGRLDHLAATCAKGRAVSELLAEALEWAEDTGVAHIHLRVAATETVIWLAAQRAGFELMGSNIFFALSTSGSEGLQVCLPSEPGQADTVVVRDAVSGDRAVLQQITRESFSTGTRFHADPTLPPEASTTLHERWIDNALSGDVADAVLVADVGGTPAGYITLRVRPDLARVGVRAAEIGLFAVSSTRRGLGLGRALLSSSLTWAREHQADLMLVDTEATNAPAVNCYMGFGFRFARSTFSFHWHGGRVERPQESHT